MVVLQCLPGSWECGGGIAELQHHGVSAGNGSCQHSGLHFVVLAPLLDGCLHLGRAL